MDAESLPANGTDEAAQSGTNLGVPQHEVVKEAGEMDVAVLEIADLVGDAPQADRGADRRGRLGQR